MLKEHKELQKIAGASAAWVSVLVANVPFVAYRYVGISKVLNFEILNMPPSAQDVRQVKKVHVVLSFHSLRLKLKNMQNKIQHFFTPKITLISHKIFAKAKIEKDCNLYVTYYVALC